MATWAVATAERARVMREYRVTALVVNNQGGASDGWFLRIHDARQEAERCSLAAKGWTNTFTAIGLGACYPTTLLS